jgi:hypothetical protein
MGAIGPNIPLMVTSPNGRRLLVAAVMLSPIKVMRRWGGDGVVASTAGRNVPSLSNETRLMLRLPTEPMWLLFW